MFELWIELSTVCIGPQGLSMALAMLTTSHTQHEISYGIDCNIFNFELEDIMVILKVIKLGYLII